MATASTSRRAALTLKGKPRDHEAKRKWILRELRSTRHKAEMTLRNTNRLLKFFEGDLTRVATAKPSALRHALRDAADFGADYAVAHLVGIWPSDRPADMSLAKLVANYLICGRIAKAADTDLVVPTASASPEISADRVLAAAGKIIADLTDADIQIDWTDHPKSEREAAIRAAIIRRVEAEKARLGPSSVRAHLSIMCNEWAADELGADIYDALEKWDKLAKDERESRRRSEQQRLLNEARRDLDECNPA